MKGLAALLAVSALASPCLAQQVITIPVSPGGLVKAVATANADTNLANSYILSLAPGTYLNEFPDPIIRPMTIESSSRSKRAVLQSTVTTLPNQKGILLNLSSLTVIGLEFTGAAIDNSLGGNGAAIRDQTTDSPASLTVQDSYFHDNQTAILQCCDLAETITITNSQFENNGNPNSAFFQHAIYIETGSLIVGNSLFCGQLFGHEIKSRSQMTMIAGNQIIAGEGAPKKSACNVGSASFDIDIPNSGVAIITGNQIVQGPSSQNHQMVVYGEDPPLYSDNSLTITKNTFTSTTTPGSTAINDHACTAPTPVLVTLGAHNDFVGVGQTVVPSGCVAP